MKAFGHNLMTINVPDAFGSTESRARPWDTEEILLLRLDSPRIHSLESAGMLAMKMAHGSASILLM